MGVNETAVGRPHAPVPRRGVRAARRCNRRVSTSGGGGRLVSLTVMERRKLIPVAVAGFLLSILNGPAHSLSVRMTPGELTAAAEDILFATVEKIVQPDPGQYVLEVHLKPIETLKGQVNKEEHFVLRLIGGVVNGVGLFCSEDPRFEAGKPVIIFLRSKSFPGAPVVGGAQGCLHVANGRVVELRAEAADVLAGIRRSVADGARETGKSEEGSLR